MDETKWSHFINRTDLTERDSERIIIEEVQARKHLYDAQHPAYMDKEAARSSYEAIARILGPDWTGDQVKSKIRSLRTRYTRCLRIHLNSVSNSGTNPDGIREPKWKWFQEMDQFLRPHVQLRKTVSLLSDKDFDEENDSNVGEDIHNLLHHSQGTAAIENREAAEQDCGLTQSPASISASATSSSVPVNFEQDSVETPPPRTTFVAQAVPAGHVASPSLYSSSLCSKKRKLDSTYTPEAGNVLNMSADSRNDESVFGEFVARELETLPLSVRRRAKFEIHKILYESGQ